MPKKRHTFQFAGVSSCVGDVLNSQTVILVLVYPLVRFHWIELSILGWKDSLVAHFVGPM